MLNFAVNPSLPMPGGASRTRTIVRDLSRGLVAAIGPIMPPSLAAWHRDAVEYLIAIELLRITPRFWPAAILSIALPLDEGAEPWAEIRCPEGFPAYASVTTTLRKRIHRLAQVVGNHGPVGATHVLVGIAWLSPRTWVYDSRYLTNANESRRS